MAKKKVAHNKYMPSEGFEPPSPPKIIFRGGLQGHDSLFELVLGRLK
jgi:hypothetical protein